METLTNQPPDLVGKSTLAGILEWSRPRLDRRLRDDPSFPVAQRGMQTGGWQFNVADVMAYLQEADVESKLDTAPLPEPESLPLPEMGKAEPSPHPRHRGVTHRGETTAAQRNKELQNALLEDKLRASRKELVQADDVTRVLSTMMARLGSSLDAMPDRVMRDASLPLDKLPALQSVVDEIRRQMVSDLALLLEPAANAG